MYIVFTQFYECQNIFGLHLLMKFIKALTFYLKVFTKVLTLGIEISHVSGFKSTLRVGSGINTIYFHRPLRELKICQRDQHCCFG